MKDMNRWKWVSQATERKIHLHNWADSLVGGRLVEAGSNTNLEGYIVWKKAFHVGKKNALGLKKQK